MTVRARGDRARRRDRRSLQCVQSHERDRWSIQFGRTKALPYRNSVTSTKKTAGARSRCDFVSQKFAGQTWVLTTTRVVIHYARATSLPRPTGQTFATVGGLWKADRRGRRSLQTAGASPRPTGANRWLCRLPSLSFNRVNTNRRFVKNTHIREFYDRLGCG